MIEPYWDDRIKSMVVQETDEWIVSVTRMIFNDRILLTHKDDYPRQCTAGWCYDQDGSAYFQAALWDLEKDAKPAGYKKEAFDARFPLDHA